MQERQPKPKRVTVSVIERDADDPQEVYRLLDQLVANYRPDLAEARIAIAWNYSWSQDKDGHTKLGTCAKASDLNRELHSYDFVISLNYDAWNNTLKSHQRLALLDHELCHAAPDLDDESGEQREDENGRLCWRIRKHDIEEFREIVSRHGTYKSDLHEFVRAANESAAQPLLAEPEPAIEVSRGPTTVSFTSKQLDVIAEATAKRKRGSSRIVVGKDLSGMAPEEIEKEILGCFDKQKGTP